MIADRNTNATIAKNDRFILLPLIGIKIGVAKNVIAIFRRYADKLGWGRIASLFFRLKSSGTFFSLMQQSSTAERIKR